MTYRAFRWLLMLTTLAVALPAIPAAGSMQQGDLYEDPNGRFSVPIPTGWTVEELDGYATLSDPDGEIAMTVLALEAEDTESAIAAAWKLVEPGFDLEPIQIVPLPDDGVVITYDVGDITGDIVQAVGQMVDGVGYVMLVRADPIAAQERQSQINIVVSGFTPAGTVEASLAGVTPLPFEGEMVNDFEAYIVETMELLDVPGATIAIVQNGEIVYRGAFGVTELGGDTPMTPETRMMIGSTTKPVTTMMLATMVDEGIIDWDTPVVDILPSFAVADPELTPQITVRDLVCACTGVPRRDLELLFNDLTAEDIVASLAEFEFFTPIGEAFQYSNQMVATAGYVGAVAVHGEDTDLHDAYVAEVTDRVLDPIGMSDSTFSFEEVEAGDHAMPHGLNLDGEYVPMSLEQETWGVAIAPSGGLWSDVDDMSRFMLTQIDRGVAPDGTRVVSAENLEATWQPQVPVDAEVSYGLGWFVDDYKDQPMMHHGGNMLGFTSDLAFLPDADIGIVVLTNGQATNLFNEAVRYRFLELVFEQEPEFQEQLDAILHGQADQPEPDTGVPAAAGTPSASPVAVEAVDVAEVEPFVGEYANDALGAVTLELDQGRLWLDAGEFRSELRALAGGPGDGSSYLMADPPMAGLPVELRHVDGEPTIVLGTGATQYTFVPAGAALVASPAAG
jgi:CubicO group peptidase (beta-lactamase class C family)